MSEAFKTGLSAVTPDTASVEQRALLDHTLATLGHIPNMHAALANCPATLSTYLYANERFRVGSQFSPAEQELVYLVISCHHRNFYCVAAHSRLADQVSNLAPQIMEAVRAGMPVEGDTALAALAMMTKRLVVSHGRPSPTEVARFLAAGYQEQHLLEIVLAIAVKTISSYANQLFHTELDGPLRPHEWAQD